VDVRSPFDPLNIYTTVLFRSGKLSFFRDIQSQAGLFIVPLVPVHNKKGLYALDVP